MLRTGPRVWYLSRVRLVFLMALACFICGLTAPKVASAQSMPTADSLARLQKGDDVRVPLTLRKGSKQLIAGISYQAYQGRSLSLLASIKNETLLCAIITFCQSAKIIGDENGETRVRITQGKGPLSGNYTLLVRWDVPGRIARFWLDTREPHSILDVFGYFRFQDFGEGKTLLTFAFAAELPFALRLVAEPIQRAALRVPWLLAKYRKEHP